MDFGQNKLHAPSENVIQEGMLRVCWEFHQIQLARILIPLFLRFFVRINQLEMKGINYSFSYTTLNCNNAHRRDSEIQVPEKFCRK